MELRQLEVLRVLAEELHFGRAARRLYLAQPSVSQLLQKLEDELGVRLVHRTSRTVRMTAAGSVFLDEIEPVFAALERATMMARQTGSGRHGVVRIATNYPGSRLLLLPLLERMRERGLERTTILREWATPEQLIALERGDLDIGIVYGPVDRPRLRSRPLVTVPVVAMVRHGHPLASADGIRFSEIPHHPYVTGYAGGSPAIERALEEAAARHGVVLPGAEPHFDPSGYLLHLEATDTIGFSSLPRAHQATSSGMRLLRIVPEEPVLELHVAWNPDFGEQHVNDVIDELIQLAEELRSGG